MFAEFNETNFPLVKVIMNDIPESDGDFQSFLNKWLELYENQQDFKFLFDTTNVGLPHLKYSIKMSQFIKKLKKEPYQYLQERCLFSLLNSREQYLIP